MKLSHILLTTFLLAPCITQATGPIRTKLIQFTRSTLVKTAIFGTGIYLGKEKPELVDQALQDGKTLCNEIYATAYARAQEKIATFRSSKTSDATTTSEEFNRKESGLQDPIEGGADNDRQD